MGTEGFEPPKSKDGRFTVCSRWPLVECAQPCKKSKIHTQKCEFKKLKTSHLPESNQRPTDYKSVALPSELKWLITYFKRTLNSILIECNSPEVIDFLSLDVEGAELDVLRGVDFNRYRFRYIVIESRNFKNTIAFMYERQYKLLKILSVSDLLFGFEENENNS